LRRSGSSLGPIQAQAQVEVEEMVRVRVKERVEENCEGHWSAG
jgi:hypothetical protein